MLGTGLQLQQAALWPPALQAAVAVAALLGLLLVARRRRGWAATAGGALALLLLAWAATDWRAAQRLAERLPPALEGQEVQVQGVVARLPQSNPAGTRFVFEVESASHFGRAVTLPPLLALAWYVGPDADAALADPEPLRAGQRWRFTVRLRQPHGNLNPHGFDAELWLFEQGLRASGYVRSRAGDRAVRLAERAGHPLERLRQDLRDRIYSNVSDPAAAGVLAALAIGDQGAIDRADWELFRVTGVAHLMSISGLHVTMFAWAAALLIGRAWRASPRLLRRLPAPLAARWGGLLLAAAYALLAGWGVPAQRTVLMIGAVAQLRTLGLRWPQPLVLLAAGASVSLLDPWALLQPGFWLSFVAVALLIASDPVRAQRADNEAGWRQRARGLLHGALRTQAVATVGLAPLSLVFFQQLSLVGFVANLVAIPLVTLLITPLALAGVLVPGLWALDAAIVKALLQGLGLLAAWPWAQWTVAAAPTWAAWLGLAGGALLVLPLPWRLRLLGLPLLLPLLAPAIEHPPPGHYELLAVDVGQGTAVLVRTHEHLLVYDAGPLYGQTSDAGQRVLLPLLQALGERRIDVLMLSHRDSDHVGGAAALLARLPVARLVSSLETGHPLLANATVPHEPCRAGQRWQWDGVDFELLHPDDATAAAGGRPNTVSCVLQVRGAQGRALLTGDIERAQEAALLQRLGADGLRSEVLLVPHHGSKTSSGAGFIDAVAPQVAVVQAGYRSRFGHPAAEVVARYAAREVPVVRSDDCGAWHWPSADQPPCERRRQARYWHHPGPGDR
ncbi:MAG: DNA internalization-related competence protein ComEC/Rec2 [Proteobacteria bacterium]|nr:DNA internalization-related competence protein ComEC/Rec2 [Pseudomonadota bacterium]